jgi:glycerophosphoryl diester phosphodiesterase
MQFMGAKSCANRNSRLSREGENEEMTVPVDHTVFISAHQGNCGIPNLSMAESYRRAMDLNVDYVEFDVRKTKDGTYVIWHDEYTPSKRYVRDLSYQEYKSELGDQALTVPELLAMAKGRVGLHVDLKETGYENEVVRLVLNFVTTEEVVITSLEDTSVRVIKERFPAKDFPMLKVGLSLGRDPRGIRIFEQLRTRLSELFPARRIGDSHADFVAVHYLLATVTVLRYCASEHIPAWVWTVDNEHAMMRFLNDPRVTTLITNRPEVALSLRATKVSLSNTAEKD